MRQLVFAACAVVVSCGSETVPGDRSDPDIIPVGSGTVTGRVLDSNGTPVPNAFVLIESDPVEVSTDAGGTFSAEVPAGDHDLSVSKWGETFVDFGISVEPDETTDLGDVGPTNPFIYARMAVREAAYRGQRFHQQNTWAALSIEDEIGVPVAGLTMSDFTVTDAIREIATGNVVAEDVIDIATQNANPFMEAGVWEHSRTRDKLDVVFLVDGTASMSDAVVENKANIQNFIDRLQTANIDFRVGAVEFNQSPVIGWNEIIPFMGDWEIDRLHADIDANIDAVWEGWSPTAAYDALMITEWLGYRDDARRVAVLLTDIVPHTVYGTYWYTVTSGTMTASAVELRVAEEGIEVFFTQNPSAHHGIDAYVDPTINPRAGNSQSGLYGLEARGFATELPSWPFDEVELSNGLGLVADRPVIDSQYLVGWEPVAGWTSPWGDTPENYEQYVTIAIDDPVRPGETLSVSFTLPLETPTTDVDINVITEGDNDPDEMRGHLFRLSGGRPVEHSWQIAPVNGVMAQQLTPGRYRIEINDGGVHSFHDTSLNAIGRADFEVGADPVSVDVVVRIAEARSMLAQARGLLRDLDDWRISGDPFRDFVIEAESWLADVEEGGISWEEMVQLRRFNTALAGYANLTEYAQLETESAVDDFVDIVADFRDVVKQVNALGATTSDEWYTELAGLVMDVVYAVLTRGQWNAKKEALKLALDDLLEYAGGELLTELKEHIVDQYPLDLPEEVAGPLIRLTFALLGADFNSEDGPDLSRVIEAATELTIDITLISVRETIIEDRIDQIVDEIPVETQWEDDIKVLVRGVLNSLIRRDQDIKHFQRALESFARAVGNTLLNEDRDATIATINRMFDHVQSRLDADPDVRDFLVGFARDLTLATLPQLKCADNDPNRCQVRYKLNTDAIVEILIRHGLYNVVLRNFYVDEVNRGLNAALSEARSFTPTAGSLSDWESEMSNDFRDYRATVGSAQGIAWNALRVQDAVDSWAEGLQSLTTMLRAISIPLDFVAALYPSLQDTADRVHIFVAVLDGIDIISQAIEFGLKIDCLNRFGNIGEDLYTQAYPH